MTHLHDYELGPRIDEASLRVLLRNRKDDPALLGILHCLRDQASELATTSRNPPPHLNGNSLEFRATAAGGCEQVANALSYFYTLMNAPAEEAQGGEGEISVS